MVFFNRPFLPGTVGIAEIDPGSWVSVAGKLKGCRGLKLRTSVRQNGWKEMVKEINPKCIGQFVEYSDHLVLCLSFK